MQLCSRDAAGFAVVEVEDSGIGISDEDLPRIFDRFFRADQARSHETPGSGLGLSIAKWVAEAHDGRIEVSSRLGQGSLFRIRLPLAREAAFAPADAKLRALPLQVN